MQDRAGDVAVVGQLDREALSLPLVVFLQRLADFAQQFDVVFLGSDLVRLGANLARAFVDGGFELMS